MKGIILFGSLLIMQHFKLQEIKAPALDALQCDCCGRHTPASEVEELQEYLRIDYEAGFGSSAFPDQSRVRGDFCQDCVKKLLGAYLSVREAPTEAERIERYLLKEGFRQMSDEEITSLQEKGLFGMPDE
jgi:hypothetical protein